jgi:WD40 repeat protein/subtilisin-like proprotein convertase family protein
VAYASAAYERLHALPGFAERADELFGAALVRASGKAATLGEASAIDARLRGLPGRDAVADGLLADYWLRRARGAANAERRDAAVLFALRAAEKSSAQQAVAAAYVRELVADDYPTLERSLRLGAAPVAWRMLFDERAVVLLDAERQMLRIPFGGAAASDAVGAPPQRLTALAHEALRREVAVDGDGSAGDLELTLLLQHPAGAELLVTLTAPSGAQATVAVPASASGVLETFVFPAAPGSALGGLADEARRGVWSLTVVDRSTDNIGTLSGWGLRFGADVWEDSPELPLAIPDPQRTGAVTVEVEGTFALVRPEQAGAVGTVALWDLDAQRLAHDLTLPAVPRTVAVSASGGRLVAATASVATVFDTASGRPAARLATDTEFVLPPVFSPDGAYFAIAERVDGAAPLFSVLRAADASLVASFEGTADAQSWQLGPGARWVAVTAADGVVSIVESGRGARIARLVPTREFARLLPLGDGTRVLTIDTGGELVVASLVGAAPLRLGVTVAAASVSVAADGARVAYADESGAVVVATATGVVLQRVRHESDVPLLGTQLAADGTELVTAGAQGLRLWSAPATAPAARESTESRTRPTAYAVARGTQLVAVGFDSGQLEIVAPAELATAGGQRLGYFGHRGAVTAVAFAAERGLAVTGGSDGIVRLWDAASGEPVGIVMQPAEAPIARVALAASGRWVASAAAQSVRVADAADGRVVYALTADAAVTALEFAPASGALAIGDAGGGVTLVALDDGRRLWSSRVAAEVAALAFGGETIAVGDAGGAVRLLGVGDGRVRGAGVDYSHGVRWLDWSDAAGTLLVATRDWLHAAGGDELTPLHGRLAPRSIADAALAAGAGTAVRLVGPDAAGALTAATIDVAALPPAAAAAPPLAPRDWPAALGLKLDAAGEPSAFDP